MTYHSRLQDVSSDVPRDESTDENISAKEGMSVYLFVVSNY